MSTQNIYADHGEAGFPLANFLARSDFFLLSISLISSSWFQPKTQIKNKGKKSLCAKIFASEKPA